MDTLGFYHPVVVHFALGLLAAGVLFRLASLTGRLASWGAAARTLLVAGTVAAVASVASGTAAHGPVERVPGSAAAVGEHEEWGERARNAFLLVVVLDVGAVVLRRWGRERVALVASGVVGLASLVALMYAGHLGGQLVYSYAGGVGIRTGDPADLDRLLVAAIYHRSQADRKAGRGEDAARLVEEAARRYPGDPGITVLVAESKLLDRKDPRAAVEALSHLSISKEDRRLRMRHGMLMADALEAAGQSDAARAFLQVLSSEYPQNERLRKRLQAVGK